MINPKIVTCHASSYWTFFSDKIVGPKSQKEKNLGHVWCDGDGKEMEMEITTTMFGWPMEWELTLPWESWLPCMLEIQILQKFEGFGSSMGLILKIPKLPLLLYQPEKTEFRRRWVRWPLTGGDHRLPTINWKLYI